MIIVLVFRVMIFELFCMISVTKKKYFKNLKYNPKKMSQNNKNKSYRPVKVKPDTNGNKKTNSISYNKKKIHINMNCIETLIGFCV